MMDVKEQTGRVVASDTQSTVSAIDGALLQQARLCATIIEASGESRLPIVATQKLFSSMSAGLAKLVESRAEMAGSIRQLQAIQSRSNLRETAFGCPGGPVMAMPDEPVAIDAMEHGI